MTGASHACVYSQDRRRLTSPEYLSVMRAKKALGSWCGKYTANGFEGSTGLTRTSLPPAEPTRPLLSSPAAPCIAHQHCQCAAPMV
eukprot:12419-Heterococcus_DN1.PRE.2